MKPKKRQKICYNCDGEIDLDVIVCPYCAADLRAEKPEQQYPAYHPGSMVKNLNSSHQQTMQSLYPASLPKEQEEAALSADSQEAALVEEKEKNIFGPTLLFALGTQLFLFGVFMLLFSHKGAMILKWDARLWFLYLFASVPLLIFGYRSISKL